MTAQTAAQKQTGQISLSIADGAAAESLMLVHMVPLPWFHCHTVCTPALSACSSAVSAVCSIQMQNLQEPL
jgi:hypothetical protein